MSKRILLVEDRADRVEWFQRRYKGQIAHVTDDPAIAIHWLASEHFDQLFLDHDLGKEPRSGRDVALWLIAHPDVLPNLETRVHTVNFVSGPKIEREMLAAGRPCVWKAWGTMWERISPNQMLRAWGVAELRGIVEKVPASDIITRSAQAGVPLATVTLARVSHGVLDELSLVEWEQIEAWIIYKREPLIKGLLDLKVEWLDGEMRTDQLYALRIFEFEAFVEKAPSRMLADLAGARHIEGTEPEFRGFGTDIERPICVAENFDGPFCLVEGYTRVCTYLRDVRAGLAKPIILPMIVGISPRIHEWQAPNGHLWWPR